MLRVETNKDEALFSSPRGVVYKLVLVKIIQDVARERICAVPLSLPAVRSYLSGLIYYKNRTSKLLQIATKLHVEGLSQWSHQQNSIWIHGSSSSRTGSSSLIVVVFQTNCS